jgi:hypothetical protein
MHPKHTRVLRGGAFNNNSRRVRCAYRNRNNPNNTNTNNGFRVVLLTRFAVEMLFSTGIAARVVLDCLRCRG